MEALQLIKDYKDQEALRKSFNRLATMTFGIDFEPWYQKGYWNERYRPYSLIHKGEVVANVSVNSMDLLWEGKTCNALQIGTVMTHPEYRKRGLAKQLMEMVFAEYEDKVDFIYLFANDSALGFYQKLGMKPLQETLFAMENTWFKADKKSARILNLEESLTYEFVEQWIAERTYISARLGVKQDKGLLMFYFLYVHGEHLYFMDEEQCLVVCEQEGEVLTLIDVINNREIPLMKVLEALATDEIKRIHFQFTPDIPEALLLQQPLTGCDSTLLFTRLPEHIIKPFRFPDLSHA